MSSESDNEPTEPTSKAESEPDRKRIVDNNRLTGDARKDLATSVYKFARDPQNRLITVARSDLVLNDGKGIESERKKWLMSLIRAFQPSMNSDEIIFTRWAYLCFWHALETFSGLILLTYIVYFCLTSTSAYLRMFDGYYTGDDLASIGATGFVCMLLSAVEVIASVKLFHATNKLLRRKFLETQMINAVFSMLFVAALATVYILNSMEAEEEMKTTEPYERYINDSDIQSAIDNFQISNKCCGITDFNTWSQIRWTARTIETNYEVPTSCCKSSPCDSRSDVECVIEEKSHFVQAKEEATDDYDKLERELLEHIRATYKKKEELKADHKFNKLDEMEHTKLEKSEKNKKDPFTSVMTGKVDDALKSMSNKNFNRSPHLVGRYGRFGNISRNSNFTRSNFFRHNQYYTPNLDQRYAYNFNKVCNKLKSIRNLKDISQYRLNELNYSTKREKRPTGEKRIFLKSEESSECSTRSGAAKPLTEIFERLLENVRSRKQNIFALLKEVVQNDPVWIRSKALNDFLDIYQTTTKKQQQLLQSELLEQSDNDDDDGDDDDDADRDNGDEAEYTSWYDEIP
ncbi:hypothetical protein HELRODRAFT_182059 [Helobdella robusta]|uniref:Tetraspanin n=1 Tax=Helobdella robusta TaxID=6412 RepID=T1FHP1_HELRO|nr:hypothetical protein HELRODRAFT_182059 [Helobdella robusta]ESN91880.1 hypothetical protein HELRODRAFT_182059 [Helobdella robusta]